MLLFFGLKLNELKIDECKLHEVDFREADLQNSSLTYCDFLNSMFAHTNLKNVDFTESCNFNIDIFNNNISQAIFTRSEAISLLDSLDIVLID
ncbi:pentapeptide repeat-containing protein [Aeromonas cavernicola]|uniref:pentapeptide repeat-containing protein n=1 Tax=Aeromonas cavernicola TaxID=1006623 RepID=UPI00191C7364